MCTAQNAKLDKPFKILSGVALGAAAFDIRTTQVALRDPLVREGNPLLGARPSPARLWAQGSAMHAGFFLGAWKEQSWGQKTYARVILGIAAGMHVYAGLHNRSLAGYGRH